MRRRTHITLGLLAAFVVTTAVPGPSVIAHRHAGGDHEHVHAVFTHGDDDHHHHDHHLRHEAEHARRHRGHAHRPRLAHGSHDPLHHTHVTSPFQPATASASPRVRSATLVTGERLSASRLPFPRQPESIRSRGPPLANRF